MEKHKSDKAFRKNNNIELKLSHKSTNLDNAHEHMRTLIRRRSSLGASVDFSDESQIFNYFISCLKKTLRSVKENQVIMYFLNKMSEFLNLIRNTHENFKDLLGIIANQIGYHYTPSNKILFRIGDKGDKFFIIFKGKVNILIPKDQIMSLTEDEYWDYILRLINNGETYLLNMCQQANESVYPLLDLKGRKKNTRRSLVLQSIGTIDKSRTAGLQYDGTSAYVDAIKPAQRKDIDTGERHEVKVWTYYQIISLKSGDYFGDLALTCFDQKRTATVFTEEDCHLGTLNKEGFDKCIKEANENQRFANINFLLSTHILCDFSQKYFKMHYLNYFVHRKMVIYDKIFVEGGNPIYTYFIKEGEFEVSFRKSLSEINDYIRYLGGGNDDEIEEEKSKMSDSPKFYKFMSEKKHYRVSILERREVVGLSDLIFNNKYGFSVECISSKGEIYKIENELLESLADKESQIKPVIDDLIYRKRRYILDRLKKIKVARLEFYYKNIEKDFLNVPNYSSATSTLLSTLNTPVTKQQQRKHKKTMEQSDYDFYDTKRSGATSTIEKKRSTNNVKAFALNLEKNTHSRNQTKHKTKESIHLTDTIHLSKEMTSTLIKPLDDTSINFEDSFFFEADRLKVHEEESNKNKMKVIEKKMKLINDKLRSSKRTDTQISKQSTFSIFQTAFDKNNKDFIENEKFEKKINFVKEQKLFKELLKTTHKNFSKDLYQRLSSNYFSEQSAIKQKNSVHVVDCLALDNFNRLYNQASLPVINPSQSRNLIQKSYETVSHSKISKNTLCCVAKIKGFPLNEKLKCSKAKPNQVSVLNLNSLVKDESFQYNKYMSQ